MSERRSDARASVLLTMACAVSGACGGGLPAPEPAPRLVRYIQISTGEATRVRRFAGVAQASEEPRLSFKVGGTVVDLAVEVGDRVSRGSLIAELDATDYQIGLEEAQAGLRRAQAETRNAEAVFGRTRDLYEKGNASRTEYDSARAGAESARAGVVSSQKRLELERRKLAYTRLTAPAAGAIASVDVDPNENVQPGQDIVMLVQSGGDLEVRVTIPESLIARLERGQPATVRFDALPDRELAAVVTEVGVAATGSGTTFPVIVRLGEAGGAGGAVRVGMAAEVGFRFEAGQDGGRLRLPAHCVGEDREGRYVWVVEPGSPGTGVVRRRAVTVGEMTTQGLEVLSGLQDGDRVITAGVSRVGDGETVRLGESVGE